MLYKYIYKYKYKYIYIYIYEIKIWQKMQNKSPCNIRTGQQKVPIVFKTQNFTTLCLKVSTHDRLLVGKESVSKFVASHFIYFLMGYLVCCTHGEKSVSSLSELGSPAPNSRPTWTNFCHPRRQTF